MRKSNLWLISIILLIISFVLFAWSMQAAWLTSFANDQGVVHELSVRFYIRGGIGFLLLIGSIVAGFKASKA